MDLVEWIGERPFLCFWVGSRMNLIEGFPTFFYDWLEVKGASVLFFLYIFYDEHFILLLSY